MNTEINEFLANLDLRYFLIVVLSCGAGVALKDLIKASACRNWPSVRGKITSLESDYKVRPKYPGDSVIFPLQIIIYVARIQYVFMVDNIQYTGSRFSLGRNPFSANPVKISNLLNKYKNKKDVEVYYNKNNPEDCVLENIPPAGYFVWCYGTLAVCLFLLVWLFVSIGQCVDMSRCDLAW
jgi:hypothetical protein